MPEEITPAAEEIDPAAPAGTEGTGDPAETPEPTAEEAAAAKVSAEFEALPSWAQSEIKSLRTESAKRRTRNNELEETLASAKTPEQFEAAVAELRTANAKLERDFTVSTLARTHNLPDAIAARIQGETAEEMAADAAVLAGLLVATRPKNDPTGGLDPTDDEGPFDPVAAAAAARARRY